MSDVNGSEREQMDFLGLRDQHPPGWGRVGALAPLPCTRRLQWMSYFSLVCSLYISCRLVFFFLFADTGSVDLEWSLQGVNKRWLIAH